jgi:hypothetical protein
MLHFRWKLIIKQIVKIVWFHEPPQYSRKKFHVPQRASQGRRSSSLPAWPLKMGSQICPVQSVYRNCHSTLSKIPKFRRCHLHRGGTQKSGHWIPLHPVIRVNDRCTIQLRLSEINEIFARIRGCIQNIPDWCRHLYSSGGSVKHR